MILTFLRSSMYGSLSLCEHRFFLDFNIKRPQKPNAGTLVGSCVHSVCEALALEKLAKQNETDIVKHEYLGEYKLDQYSIEEKIRIVYDKYDKEFPEVFNDESYKKCQDSVKKVTTFLNGAYDPRNANIIAAELPFDIEIKKPWAFYSYDTPSGKIEGYLRIKGTVDVLAQENDDTYHILDYKTGGLINWSNGKVKDLKYMQNEDKQLKLYFYAICHVFSHIENFLITIFYMNENKAFTVVFERKDLPKIEKNIKETFQQIQSIVKPKLKERFTYIEAFKRKIDTCKFCNHSKTKEVNGQTTCEFFKDKIISDGMESVLFEFANFDEISRYGSGGGKGDRE